MEKIVVLSILALLMPVCEGRSVALSNTELPRDTQGRALITGEASILHEPPSDYYVYFNNWGGCRGIDCCDTPGGCASCCFNPSTPAHPDGCVYTANHTVVAYHTSDFQTWDALGAVLAPSQRVRGIEFRPQVIFSPYLRKYLMWYEDRWTNGTNHGYAVANAPSPRGPFTTLTASVVLPGKGRVGDFSLFVDDDGSAYHVRTGLTIAKLNTSFTGPAGAVAELAAPNLESPVMFKHNAVYFILAGRGCCACRGGSNIEVFTSSSPLGPFTHRGDIGSNPQPFNPHSPLNYVTAAQMSAVVSVKSSTGVPQLLLLSNQWVTSRAPGQARNADLLYWTLLRVEGDTSLAQLVRQDVCLIDV